MITCKECKYWKNWECSCKKFIYGGDIDLGFVYQGDIHYGDKKLHDMLIYEDYEGYSAGFRVGPNFGCIHGVKK